MKHDRRGPSRRSIRLKGYDYSRPGAYFVTIVTKHMACLFGEVIDGRMRTNVLGEIVGEEWLRSAGIREEIELFADEFVVMPNHVHGIVRIVPTAQAIGRVGVRATGRGVRATGRSPVPRGPAPSSLGSFIAGFKCAATRRINALRGTPGAAVWHRNYYEHIIRDDESMCRIRQYIANNPIRWTVDRTNASRRCGWGRTPGQGQSTA